MNSVDISSNMIGNFMYHGTYETYLGEFMRAVKPSDIERCNIDIANTYLDMLESIISEIVPNDISDTFSTFSQGVSHPRFYNFSTDSVLFRLEYEDTFKAWLFKYANDNMEKFDSFLYDKFTSHDGFVSYTPNNYSDWYFGFSANDDRCVGAILRYVLFDNRNENDDTCLFYMRVSEMISETYTPYEYAVKFDNGCVGYCVSVYDEGNCCDRFDAYLIDTDGNVFKYYLIDNNYEYCGSAYYAWENELEYDVTKQIERFDYSCTELDVAMFHSMFDAKIDAY